MNNLIGAIERVKSKVSKHSEFYSRNEEAVKQQLIFEILEALGWDIKNPDEVRPEDKTGMGRADYALILNGSVVAYLEAKKLSIDIVNDPNPLKQLGKYCYDKGVNYGILTNGVQWRVMKSFELGKTLEERILFETDLLKDPKTRAAFLLSFLSKERIVNLEELAMLFNQLEIAFRKLGEHEFNTEEILSALTVSEMQKDKETKPQLAPDTPSGVTLISNLQDVTYTQPVKAVVKFSTEWIVLNLRRHTWRELLEKYSEFILKREGKLPYIPGYVVKNVSELKSGRKDGKDRHYSRIGDYYIYIWMSANDILRLLKKLQEASGIKLAIELEKKR